MRQAVLIILSILNLEKNAYLPIEMLFKKCRLIL